MSILLGKAIVPRSPFAPLSAEPTSNEERSGMIHSIAFSDPGLPVGPAELELVMRIFNSAFVLMSATVALVSAQVSNHSDSSQSDGEMSQFMSKAENLLIKDDSIRDHFEISDQGVTTFQSPEEKKKGVVEWYFDWDEIEAFRQLIRAADREVCIAVLNEKSDQQWSNAFLEALPEEPKPWKPREGTKKLQGARIALDPGHFGGTMENAEIEGKYIRIRASELPDQTEPIAFNEGNLNLATARILEQRLKEEGAEVFMTRTEVGIGAIRTTPAEWLESDFEKEFDEYAATNQLDDETRRWWLEESTSEDKFRRFLGNRDLRERAKLVNRFDPDLTVIIHYNFEGEDKDESGYFKPGTENFNMAFVGGSYASGELSRPDQRFEFLRQLLTDDLERSVHLSGEIVKAFTARTDVPLRTETEGINYLEKWSMTTEEPGVYARNIGLTRLIHGPICFGETFCQNHIGEAVQLNRREVQVGDLEVSARVQSVADAYFEGILSYLTDGR